MAKQDTGCISYIGMISIIIMSIYVLFTNPGQFFESAFNILSSLVIIVLIVYLAIFFPSNSKEQKPIIKEETKLKEEIEVLTKIPEEEKINTNERNNIYFLNAIELDLLVLNLENYSSFAIEIDEKIKISCSLIYKSENKSLSFNETFNNFEEAISYLKNLN